MRFEIGKYYEDSSGNMMAFIAYAKTHIYGRSMIAEGGNDFDFRLIRIDAGDYAKKWKEIGEEEWLSRSTDRKKGNDYPTETKDNKKPTDEMKIYLEGYRQGQLDLMRELV